MKKAAIIFFLCLFSICVVSGKSQDTFIEKIDLKLKEGEIGLLFLPIEEDVYLLFKTKENTILLGAEEHGTDVKKALKKLGQEKIDYNISEQKIGKNQVSLESHFQLDDISIEKKDDNYIVGLQDKKLTIYKAGPLEETEYVYFLEDTEIEKGDINLAFYGGHIEEEFEKELSTYWIDSYKIKKNEFTIVKFTEDSYNVIRIPEQYF